MNFTAGIDVGNYDTKTQHTTTPSSYQVDGKIRNKLADQSIFYNGLYYSPTWERNNQQTDKTHNDYCLVMSLFAIGKEIVFQIKEKYPEFSNAQIQEKIDEIDSLKIGVGIPIGLLSAEADKMKETYLNAWKDGFEFEYNDFKFNLKLTKCSVFPQDLTPILLNEELDIINTYDDIYVFGIGGGTVDVIPCHKKMPVTEKCFSIEKGSTVMYAEIIKKIQQEFGKTMDYTTVEKVLLNQPTVIDEARKERIKEHAKVFTDKLVDEFMHLGLSLGDYPSVFIGGGALLIKDNLMNNENFVKAEFIEDVHANAKSFAIFA